MAATAEGASPDLAYEIKYNTGSYSVIRQGQSASEVADIGDLLFILEKDITVELQIRRPDHLFLHSAALDWQGRACLLTADAGSGKSLVTWGLLHHGFAYLSDELSPIDLDAMQVAPYPHALCLKHPPPPAYPLPREAIHLGPTIHVPVACLPGPAVFEPRPLGAVFLLRYCPDLHKPDLRAISPAEAAARLYVNALNALSQPNRGLDAVLRLAGHVPCYTIASAELGATCASIHRAVGESCARTITSDAHRS